MAKQQNEFLLKSHIGKNQSTLHTKRKPVGGAAHLPYNSSLCLQHKQFQIAYNNSSIFAFIYYFSAWETLITRMNFHIAYYLFDIFHPNSSTVCKLFFLFKKYVRFHGISAHFSQMDKFVRTLMVG